MVSAGENYLAFDLGAESGRAVLGTFTGDRLELHELHRFANRPTRIMDSQHWNVLQLWEEIKEGLGRAATACQGALAGIGLDTWGVDYALLDRHGALLGVPYHYRDSRTEGIDRALFRRHSEWELYDRTGMSYSPVNTLCQLLAQRRHESAALEAAHTLLMMPCLFNYWLSGRQANEVTIAGSTQFHDIRRWEWCQDILESYDLPSAIMGELVPSGTELGPLLPSVAEETGLRAAPVIATACHDTPAAVAAVPSRGAHITFISSGTWSVVGTEMTRPLLSAEGLAKGFVVETGACGRVILVHNSMGLWPLQQCRQEWLQQGVPCGYAELAEMAARARPFSAIVDPDDMTFFQPGAMTTRVAAFVQHSGQVLESDDCGAVTRVLLEGLALRYRKTIEDLDQLTGWSSDAIHIVGGGSRNELLCQFTADATNRTVVAGPAEATATATALLQAYARGSVSSLEQIRDVVANSYQLATYEPRPSAAWDDAYGKFLRITRSQ